MKILLDIGHPGHVHYFRNLISLEEEAGNECLITARDKDVTFELLKSYGIPFKSRGKGSNKPLGKLVYMLIADIILWRIARKFKPDVFLSFSSPYAAQVAWIMAKPHIALNDTEHTDSTHKLFTYPFSRSIVTPDCYLHDLGAKQVRFKHVIEGLYLHPNYYTPDDSILGMLGIAAGEKYVVFRLVSWFAHHDVGESGMDQDLLKQLIHMYGQEYRVFVSSESELSSELEPYRLDIQAEQMHDVLYHASAFIGESGTMSSESAILGTPVIYINSLPLMGYLKLAQEHGLLWHFKTSEGVLDRAQQLLAELKEVNFQERSQSMQADFNDPTEFLERFISQSVA